MVVDLLAAQAGGVHGQERDEAWVAQGQLAGTDVMLAKPLTFMNRSGVAVERLLAANGGDVADLIVIVDDVALPLGTLRLRESGSHGGHNGLRSLIEVLGREDFARLRVGIGAGPAPGDLAGFVLGEFAPDEVLVVQELVGRAADAVCCLLKDGAAAAMSRYNGPAKA